MRYEKIIFVLYLLCFLIVAGTLAIFQPHFDTPPLYGNPPDEHAKYLIPRYIAEYGVLPTGFEEEVRLEGYGFSYGFYNVLPYIIQGYFMRLISLITDSELALLYAGRSVNILFGVFFSIIIYKLAQKLFADTRLRWLFCFLNLFLPQSLFIHTYVNTDSMALLSTAMIVYAWVGIYKDGYDRENIFFLSGGIIICALSYYNAYGFILSSILLFLNSFLEKNGKYDWKGMLKKGSMISLIVLIGIGWWFIRSYILYDGDLIGFRTRDEMAMLYGNPNYMNTYKERGFTVLQMFYMNDFFTKTFYSFIAGYGSLSIFANIWLYRFYLTFLAVCVSAYFLFRKGDKISAAFNWKWFFFHVNMVFCAVLPLLLLIYYAYSTDYQAQGRYLLPGLVPLMYYVTAGFEKIMGLRWISGRLKNAGFIMVYLFIFSCLFWMVYRVSLPVYLS
ncbi:MAG: hypothetical protein FWG91_00305 [Lachnospiraceae bacterium]|nr:hypothetical protein [Lachnospiraceae bacterium]